MSRNSTYSIQLLMRAVRPKPSLWPGYLPYPGLRRPITAFVSPQANGLPRVDSLNEALALQDRCVSNGVTLVHDQRLGYANGMQEPRWRPNSLIARTRLEILQLQAPPVESEQPRSYGLTQTRPCWPTIKFPIRHWDGDWDLDSIKENVPFLHQRMTMTRKRYAELHRSFSGFVVQREDGRVRFREVGCRAP
jgi:hypothetical protein